MIIYKATCKITNKIYIGQTTKPLEERIDKHLNQANSDKNLGKHINHFRSAIIKYGIENFAFTIICECSEEELDEKEIFYINEYNSYYNGYNSTKGGKGTRGHKFTDEQKNKISKALTGLKRTEETKQKISEANKGDKNSMYGKIYSEEERKRISERNKGENNYMFGKTHSDEVKEKLKEQNAKKVGQFDLNNNLINEFKSVNETLEKLNIDYCYVHFCKLIKANKIINNEYYFKYLPK